MRNHREILNASVLVILFMTLLIMVCESSAAGNAAVAPSLKASAYSGGSGTEADPYQIRTADDWIDLSTAPGDWDNYFILVADIDFGKMDLQMVGSETTPFSGYFDGQGHKMNQVNINFPDNYYVGLFGYVGLSGEILRLGCTNIHVTGKYHVGGLVGHNQGKITACRSEGVITGEEAVGGLIGLNNGQNDITLCSASGTVTGECRVGGLIGSTCYDTTIRTCYADCTVTGYDYVGGLVGGCGTECLLCYTSGQVIGTGGINIGGLIGENEGVLTSCHTWAEVNTTGGNNIGGLVGYNVGSSITNCHAESHIQSDGSSSCIGGLVGRAEYVSINSCYTACTAIGGDINGCLVGKSTEHSTISYCHTSGLAFGGPCVGGLVAENDSEITLCYARSQVVGAWEDLSNVGLLVGRDLGGTVTSSYCMSHVSIGEGWERTLEEMSYPYAANTFVDWFDGSTSWKADIASLYSVEGFPYLEENPGFYQCTKRMRDTVYIIQHPIQFIKLANTPEDWDKNYVLYADLDFMGASLPPIGNSETPFVGSLDGNGHSVRNITIYQPESDFAGLFGYVRGDAEVFDLDVEGIVVLGKDYVGGMAGKNDGEFVSCSVTGTVQGVWSVGGFAGQNHGVITSCDASGTAMGSSECVGGLVGWNYGSLVECYAKNEVAGYGIVGGLAGVNRNDSQTASIKDCYAMGPATGGNKVGGLAGENRGSIARCYAAGAVTGTGYDIGGLTGLELSSSNTHCYWDMETTGQSVSAGGTGRTSGQMTFPYDLTDTYAFWDFMGIWAHDYAHHQNHGYPYLRSHEEEVESDNAVRTINDAAATIGITPPKGTSQWGVMEYIPSGLTVSSILGSHGTWDAKKRTISWWGEGSVPVTLHYEVSGANALYRVSGLVYFGGDIDYTISGDETFILTGESEGEGEGEGENEGEGEAIRTITDSVATIAVIPPPGTSVWGVAENIPEALTVSNITGSNGTWDAVSHKIQWWGTGSDLETLSYEMSGPNGTYEISGVVSYDGPTMNITGDDMYVSGVSDAMRTITGSMATIELIPPPGTSVWGVEEYIPEALTVSNITGSNGTWDAVNQKIQWWGTGSDPATLSYEMSGPNGTYKISGAVSYDGPKMTIAGDDTYVSYPMRTITDSMASIVIAPPPGTSVWGVEEYIPDALTVSNITGSNGTWDAVNQKIQWWGTGSDPATLSYEMSGPNGTYKISGAVSYDGPTMTIAGDDTYVSHTVRTITGSVATIEITPPSGTSLWGVTEYMPEALTVSNITGSNGTWDAVSHKIQWWGTGSDPVTLSYEMNGPNGIYRISGIVSYDGPTMTIAGDDTYISFAVRTITGRNVTFVLTPRPRTSVWYVQEYFPEALTVSNITGSNGTWDPIHHTVSWWGTGSDPVTLGYELSGPDGTYEVSGIVSYDDQTMNLAGDGTVVLDYQGEGENPALHPADENEDSRIVMADAIAYLAGWQHGSNPMNYAIRAAYIWQNGERYIYDPAANPPLCWVLAASKDPKNTLGKDGSGQAVRIIDSDSAFITVMPDPGSTVWGVEQLLLGDVSEVEVTGPHGAWDPANHKVTWWGTGDASASLTCKIPGAPGVFALSGAVSFDGSSSAISDQEDIQVAGMPEATTGLDGEDAGITTDTEEDTTEEGVTVPPEVISDMTINAPDDGSLLQEDLRTETATENEAEVTDLTEVQTARDGGCRCEGLKTGMTFKDLRDHLADWLLFGFGMIVVTELKSTHRKR